MKEHEIRKLSNFCFFEEVELLINGNSDKELYFRFINEVEYRLAFSVSEGGSAKLKKAAKDLEESFVTKSNQVNNFSEDQDVKDFVEISQSLI